MTASTESAAEIEVETEDHGADIAPGTVLVDRYRVLEVLGRGGMGYVYLGEHLEIGRKVAIKVLLSRWSETESIVRRFKAEARTASSVGHPNIVQVFDAGSLPDGRLFLVMEHLAGRDLEAEMIDVDRFDVERACHIMRQIALALGAGHRAGVIHRDLKPGNVMLVQQGDDEVVKVLDFGIAANAGLVLKNGERLTDPGSLMGTPEYMAPEQATNAPPKPTFDVYAMGVILYEMLTGELPFNAIHAFELLTLKLNKPAPPADSLRPGIPPGLVELIDDCLHPDPAARPRDGDAVAARLEDVLYDLHEQSVIAEKIAEKVSSPTPIETMIGPLPGMQPEPWFKREPALVGVLLVLCVAAASILIWRAQPEPEPEPEPMAAVVPQPDPTPPPAKTPPKPPPKPPPDLPLFIPEDLLPPEDPPPDEPVTPPDNGGKSPKTVKHTNPDAYNSPRCQRVRSTAEEARRAQRWAALRDSSRQRECWATSAEAKKLETKALMELGDFRGCMSVGKGLKDQEAQGWLKLCEKRVNG